MYEGAEESAEEEVEEAVVSEEDDDIGGSEGEGGAGGRGRGRGRGGQAVLPCMGSIMLIGYRFAFAAEVGPVPPPHPPGAPPEHTVDVFLIRESINMICVQTNIRAAQELASAHPPPLLAKWKPVKDAEDYGFLSVIITMGLQPGPYEEDYWTTEELLMCLQIKSIMPRERFREIKHCLMVASPERRRKRAR